MLFFNSARCISWKENKELEERTPMQTAQHPKDTSKE